MYKKILISLMIFTIFFISLPKNQVSANPLLARVVGGTVGERVLVGIAEKAGQQYATKTAGKQAIERWNMELYEDLVANHSNIDLRHAEAFKNLNSADVIPIPSKPGYGKVLVSAAMFLTGADVMTDVYNATLTAFNEAGMMERIMDYKQSVSSGSTLRSYRGATTFIRNGQWHFGFNVTGAFMSLASPSVMSPDKPALVNIFNVEDIGYGRMMLYFNYSGFNDKNKVYVGSNTSYVFDSIFAENDWKTIAEKVSETHLPKIAEVPWLQPYTETGIVPNWFPETVEVEIPLTDTDWSTETPTPWNEPLLEPVAEPVPDPGDIPSKNPILPGSPTLPESPTVPGTEPVAPKDPVAPVDPVKDAPGEELTLWDWLKNLLNKILDWLKAIWQAILSIPSFLLDWFKYFGQLLSWIGNLLDALFSWIGEWLKTIVTTILSVPDLIGDGLKKLFIPSDPIGDLVDPLITDFKKKFNTPSDFAFLSPSNLGLGNSCGIEDQYVTIFGVKAKILDASFLLKYSQWFKPIMSAFFWFMFGWWLFRRMNMMASKNGGASW